MKKLILITVILITAFTMNAQNYTGYLLRGTQAERPFPDSEVHTAFSDSGDYNPVTMLYDDYRMRVKVLTVAQALARGIVSEGSALIIEEFEINPVTHLVNYAVVISSVQCNAGYTSGYLYPKYDLAGNCSIRYRTVSGTTYTFTTMWH